MASKVTLNRNSIIKKLKVSKGAVNASRKKAKQASLKCSSELPTWVITASQQFDHFLVYLRALRNQKDIWCRQTIQWSSIGC